MRPFKHKIPEMPILSETEVYMQSIYHSLQNTKRPPGCFLLSNPTSQPLTFSYDCLVTTVYQKWLKAGTFVPHLLLSVTAGDSAKCPALGLIYSWLSFIFVFPLPHTYRLIHLLILPLRHRF